MNDRIWLKYCKKICWKYHIESDSLSLGIRYAIRHQGPKKLFIFYLLFYFSYFDLLYWIGYFKFF